MSDGEDKSGVSLVAATDSDVAALVAINAAAFKSDQFSALMLLDRDEKVHQNLMTKSVGLWMSDATASLIQAVEADGEIVGFSCWIIKDDKKTKADSSLPAAESKSVSVAPPSRPQTESGDQQQQTDQQPNPTKTPAQVLGGLMRKDLTMYEEKHMQGTKYMILQALSTSPACQGRGIGSKLVQWGTDRADAEGLLCWIHASPASYRLYERAGFREVGRSDYDLDEWAPGGKGGNRGWGRYTFRYMVRQPKSTVQRS
jgi:ribosomal protein S18 acetylase RimI-like enzyme